MTFEGQHCTCHDDVLCALHGTGVLRPEQLVVEEADS